MKKAMALLMLLSWGTALAQHDKSIVERAPKRGKAGLRAVTRDMLGKPERKDDTLSDQQGPRVRDTSFLDGLKQDPGKPNGKSGITR